MSYRSVKIILSGGGTGGSVSPLLAVAERMSDFGFRISDFLWIGTRDGVEKEMVEKADIEFKSIISGKLRRYFSLENLIDPFKIIVGFFQASAIILKWKPNIVMSAGSFVSVPVIWAAWFWGVKTMVHQQDVRPGLANRLMAPFASVITVAFKKSLADYGKKAVWTGNPARRSLALGPRAQGLGHSLKLKKDVPVVLVVGGGTGAMAINEVVWESLEKLTKICQVVHVAGKGKIANAKLRMPNYFVFEILEHGKLMSVMSKADVVVTRAGLGLLTEIANLEKAAIIIPIPDSHQEDNARIFKEKEAAIVLDQEKLNTDGLVDNIKSVLNDKMLSDKLRNNVSKVMKPGANKNIVKIIERLT